MPSKKGTKKIELVLAQFGEKAGVLEPSLSSFKKYFPNAPVTLYTDVNLEGTPNIDKIRVVSPPFRRDDTRYGWHSSNLYKVVGLLESRAEVAIAFDCDMVVFSKDIYTLVPLTRRFGVCLPANPRNLVRIDTEVGAGSDRILDETRGCGLALNTTPISFFIEHRLGREFLRVFCDEIINRPVRAPLAMWRASWKTGFAPYILPFQWCVCKEHIGIGNEIILHVGHEKVRRHYLGPHSMDVSLTSKKLPRFLKLVRRLMRTINERLTLFLPRRTPRR